VSGESRSLDLKVEADETVREQDVADPAKLARLLTRLVKENAALRKRFVPRRTDFEDLDVGTGTTHRLNHGFGGRVRWWVIEQIGSNPQLVTIYGDTDKDTLVLYSGVSTRVTVRVEEAG